MSARARRWTLVAAILIGAFALRVGEIQRVSYQPVFDAGSYMSLARQITVAGDFSGSHQNGVGAGRTHGPSAYFPPGLPYQLALVDLIDHASKTLPLPDQSAAFTHETIQGARYSQAVLGTIAVGLTGLVALECFGALTALIAMLLAAIYPVFIELSGVLVAENLLTVFVLATVWALLRAFRARSLPRQAAWVAAAGVGTGLTALTHFNGAVIVIPAALAVWGRARQGRRWYSSRSLVPPAVLVACTVLTVAPWTIRNAIELHSFVPVSDEAGMTLVGTYNSGSAHNTQVPYKWRFFAAIPGEHQLYAAAKQMSEVQLEGKLQHQALDYISAHPGSPFAVGWHNLERMFELEGSAAWHFSARAVGLPSGTALIGIISFWVLCLLAIAGLFGRVTRRAPRWLWSMPVLLLLSVVFVNVETPRFREPVDAFLILLAAAGIASLSERIRPRRPAGITLAPGGIALAPAGGRRIPSQRPAPTGGRRLPGQSPPARQGGRRLPGQTPPARRGRRLPGQAPVGAKPAQSSIA